MKFKLGHNIGCGYYIYVGCSPHVRYLHRDLTLNSTCGGDNHFFSREEAEYFISRYNEKSSFYMTKEEFLI